MDRVRSAFNGLQIKSERYSRFTLQPAEDGERHAEVNLSDDATEMQEHGSPSFRPAPLQRNRITVIYMVLGAGLIFSLGIIIGCFSQSKPQQEPMKCESKMIKSTTTTTAVTTKVPHFPPPVARMDWKELTKALAAELDENNFSATLGNFDLSSRKAGSAQDMSLANKIFDTFTKLQMDPWTDVHYVQLPDRNRERPNKVQFGSVAFNPSGYLAYSATGTVQGRLVYGNYGRPQDLDFLENNKIELKDCVLLLRVGNLSFAEQVDNAARRGASAVLIYPDSQERSANTDTPFFGHVHLGSGDPYTPGFPSFNHTQFPPTKSSGLPKILAQTITGNEARRLFEKIGGPEPDPNSGFIGKLLSVSYRLGGMGNITVEVNNVLTNREIHNVFGVIKGLVDPDRYVVLGAQRDAWGAGYTKATVGTSALVELAKAFHAMVEKEGFRPRRSIIFASWSAGEYGSVGATEWLEAYMSSISRNVLAYISLDGIVMGHGSLIASASPLLYSLIESSLKEVDYPFKSGSLYDMVKGSSWETNMMRPMTMDDPSYPFLAFSGIPSVSFHFISNNKEYYTYYGTNLDTKDHLNYATNQRTNKLGVVAAQFAGQMTLRLIHDHALALDVTRYTRALTVDVSRVYQRVASLSQAGKLKDVSPDWLSRARGSFVRAADSVRRAISNTDETDPEGWRILNDRLMTVERCLLSPYVSPVGTPFRHLLFGRGPHTLSSIAASNDMEELHTQLALATWTLQSCANAVMGSIGKIDNEI